jgi:hypothetical protein
MGDLKPCTSVVALQVSARRRSSHLLYRIQGHLLLMQLDWVVFGVESVVVPENQFWQEQLQRSSRHIRSQHDAHDGKVDPSGVEISVPTHWTSHLY